MSRHPHRIGAPVARSALPRQARAPRRLHLLLRVLLGGTQLVAASPYPALAQLAPNARPTGGQVVAGQISISQTPSTTTINQSTANGVVNWQTFNVGSAQTVKFQQPSSSAVTLNRVVGPNPSEIAGTIRANGQIVITNQAGLTFIKGSQVDTSGIVVSAAGISNSNFMAGKMVFNRPSDAGAKVVNNGTITVNNQGLAALVAPQVRNTGSISAKLGTVILAGAQAETLDLYGDGLVSINVTKQVRSAPDGTKALVTNTGDISAQGGTVVLTAQAVDGVVQTLVDAGGRIAANSMASHTGQVLISGRGGDVVVDGDISAQGKAAGTTGGSIMVNGSGNVVVAAGSQLNASGNAGGGTIAVGTTLARAKGGSRVTGQRTARRTTVAAGSVINASATGSGNGGIVTVLSGTVTIFNGTIEAQGGPNGGNGGSVETSGAGLAVGPTARVDAMAPKGTVGNWLLAPLSITVATGGTGTPTQTGDATDAITALTVDPASIDTAEANVSLEASTFVTFTSPVNIAGSGISLNVGAGGAVTVNAPVTTNNGGFTIQGFNGAPSAGSFTSTAAITTGTGNISINTSSPIDLGGNLSGATAALTSGSTISQTAGAITVGTLTGGSSGAVDLATGTNDISTIGAFTAGGAFSLNNGTNALQFTGPFNGSGQTLTLTAGAITQTSTGTMTVGTLTGSSSGAVNLATAVNDISNIGVFMPGGAFSLNNGANPLQFIGAFAGGGQTLTLTAGPITQTAAGVITAGTLAGSVSDSVGLATDTNDISSIGAFTAGRAFSLNNGANALQFTGPFLGAGQTLTLTAGPITQTAGVIAAGTLTGTSSGAVNLSAGVNNISNLGPFTAGGNFTLNNGTNPLQFTGAFTDGGQILTLTAGAITQTAAGVITIGTLTGSASGAVNLDTDVNKISNLGAFTAGGAFSLNNGTTALQVTGPFSGVGQTLTLNAGPVTQTLAGAITAATLTGSSSGGVDLATTVNDISSIGAFTAGGAFNLNNGTNALQFTGPFAGGGQTLTLNAGAITQTATGVTTVGTLTGSSSGSVDLGTAVNAISNLGAFTAVGNFTLVDGMALTIAGTLQSTGGNVFLEDTSPGGITFGAPGSIQTALTGQVGLQTDSLGNGTATVSTGTFELAPFTPGGAMSLGTAAASPLSLLSLAGIDATTVRLGAVTLSSGIDPTTTAGTIMIGGTGFDATGTAVLDLRAANAIDQTAGLQANLLTDGSSSIPTIDLQSSTNSIAQLGYLRADTLNLTDQTGLTTNAIVGGGTTTNLTINGSLTLGAGAFVSGTSNALSSSTGSIIVGNGATVSGGTITLAALNGGLTLGGLATDGGAGSVALFAGAGGMSQQGTGTLVAGTLSGTTSGTAVLTGGATPNQVATIGSFAAGGFTLNDGTSLTVAGMLNGGASTNINVQAGSLTVANRATVAGTSTSLSAQNALALGGTVTDGGAGTVSLSAGYGGISQLGTGMLISGTLNGATSGAATLTGGSATTNLVANIGNFTANGFALNDGSNLTVAGTLNGNASTSIGVQAGSLTVASGATVEGTTTTLSAQDSLVLAGTVTDGGTVTDEGAGADGGAATNRGAGSVALFAGAGGISQQGTGTLVAGTLSGATSGAAILSSDATATANRVATIGNFTATNGFALNNGSNLTVAGTLNGGTTATITNAAPLVISGTATAAALSLQGTSLAIPGTVAGSGTANLVASNGNIRESGALAAGTLTGGSAGTTTLSGASPATNQVGTIGAFSAAGFTLQNGRNLTIAGTLSGGASIAVQNAAPLVISGTAIAGTVTLQSTDATLNLAAGGTVQASGNASLEAATSLTQAGTVIAATAAFKSDSGNVTQGGTTNAANIEVTAPGTVTLEGAYTGVQSNGALNPRFQLPAGSFPDGNAIGASITAGSVSILGSTAISGAGGGPADLVITLLNAGSLNFVNFYTPATQLYLNLGAGTARGQIDVRSLQIQYTPPGTPALVNLQGLVGGSSGSSAASASFIQPQPKGNYQLNGCPIQSVSCIQIVTLTPPVNDPLQDLQVSSVPMPDDFSITLPDVGEKDY